MTHVSVLMPRLDMPYTITTGDDVCPDLVDTAEIGHHRSVVVLGQRVWWFETFEGRALFKINATNGAYRRKRKTE